MNILKLAEEARLAFNFDDYPDIWTTHMNVGREEIESFADLVEAAARADERDFIATKWENLYGYDKQGVAEFIRKRANTQGEQHEQTN